MGVKENNGRVWQKKAVSKKNQGLQHRGREEELGTLLLVNDKNNVVDNYLLSYLSKGLSKAKDKLTTKKINE